MNSKPFFTSKTLVVNGVIALAALIPGVDVFVRENPDLVIAGIGFLNILLRVVTKSKVALY